MQRELSAARDAAKEEAQRQIVAERECLKTETEKAPTFCSGERSKLENDVRNAQSALESQRHFAQRDVESQKAVNDEKTQLERQWVQATASSESQRMQQVFEAHKTETERLKQIELAEVKAECQRALADQMRAFQDSLSEKEAQRIAEKDSFRNAGEVEHHKAKVLASD